MDRSFELNEEELSLLIHTTSKLQGMAVLELLSMDVPLLYPMVKYPTSFE
jgi:hypothetical protein